MSEGDRWNCSVNQVSLRARGCDGLSIPSLFEIILTDSCGATTLTQVLKTRRRGLTFFALARAHKGLAQVIQRCRIVGLGRECNSKRSYCFRVLALLRVDLAQIDVCADVVGIDL